MMHHFISSVIIISIISRCVSINYPGHTSYPKYDVEEINSKQQSAYQKASLSPNSIYDQNQLNQYQYLNQLNQYQLGQMNQQNTHQYLAALQQYAASKQPENAIPATYSNQPQNFGQSTPQQQIYPHPLGVLYSPASDVSQFQFSGNGVNYSF